LKHFKSSSHCAWQRIATKKSRFVKFRYREAMLATYRTGVDELMDDARRLKVRVLKKDGYWVGLSDDLAGGSTGDTLPELFAEVEFCKRSRAGSPDNARICVEYVAGQPEIAPELDTIDAAYLALPPHLRPIAVAWDLDRDQPADPLHVGPYTNPDQLRYLEQLHAHL
jgi:hypothetical protein